MAVRLKRIYEAAGPEDGARYLVERLWPRGVSKGAAALTGWLRGLTPSPELHVWYGHEPGRWKEFQRRYRAELAAPEKQARLRELAAEARAGTITLVFAARAWEISNAMVLRKILAGLMAAEEGEGGEKRADVSENLDKN